MRRGFVKPQDQEPCVEGFEFYLDAFRELSTTRPVGLDIGAIPFTAIADYFRIYELRDFDDFIYIIRRMDYTFRELNAETAKAEGTKDASRDRNAKNHHKR